jgi:EAL domain-containing protein (putative c-di-GMP-specific phosphodiesterase class I)
MAACLTRTTRSLWVLTGQTEEGGPLRDIAIQTLPFQVGRRPGLSLTIPSRTISNLHAEFFEQGDAMAVRDLGSTNGTFVNGERLVSEKCVKEGDLIQFSNMVFRLKTERETGGAKTLLGDNCEEALALIQFDRLINDDAITPAYQPIVRSEDLSVVAYEVLGRSPVFGLRTADQMFRAAAQLNQEAELSRKCRHVGLRAFPRRTSTRCLYLNTHPVELQNVDALIASLGEVRCEFPDCQIMLEIHEGAITSPRMMRRIRDIMRNLNVQLAYDDFGCGQPRLIELMEVPPDVLKFDMKLTRELHRATPNRKQMLKSLVTMIRDAGIQALAEGMESAAESEACLDIGFDLYQGYFYGEPKLGHDLF